MQKFSVLMSIYRKENPLWFREALDSVFAQTIQPSEIVLVKDGPLTAELESIINEYIYLHPIFNIVVNETNLGLGLALQKGVLACQNGIIARMDTDDIIPKDRFEKQLAKIEEGYDVVSCWSQLFLDKPNNIIAIKQRPEKHEDIVKLAHRCSPVCHAGSMYRRSAVIAAGNYQHRQYYEDYNLWIRMILAGARFYNIQEVLYYVRTTEAQMNRRTGLSYLRNELNNFQEFYDVGFYTWKDLFINVNTRIVVRLMPKALRSIILKRIWSRKR